MSDPSTTDTQDYVEKLGQLRTLLEELVRGLPTVAKHEGARLYEQGGEKACAVTRRAIDTVKRHPLETAAVAVGAGLITWWLVSRGRNAPT